MVRPDLIKEIRQQFMLDWFGIHGLRHFQRVRENGLRLAEETMAKKTVVELLASSTMRGDLTSMKMISTGEEPPRWCGTSTGSSSICPPLTLSY